MRDERDRVQNFTDEIRRFRQQFLDLLQQKTILMQIGTTLAYTPEIQEVATKFAEWVASADKAPQFAEIVSAEE